MKPNPHLNRCLNYTTHEKESIDNGSSTPRITVNADTVTVFRLKNGIKKWRDFDWYLNNNYKNNKNILYHDWFIKNIRNEYPKKRFKIYKNAIFSVTKKKILKHPKEYYENLIKEVNWHIEPVEGHFFERSWYYIFNDD